jgi:hypothetical protein
MAAYFRRVSMARRKIWANTARTTAASRSAKYRPDRIKSRGFKGSFDKPAFRKALEKALCQPMENVTT